MPTNHGRQQLGQHDLWIFDYRYQRSPEYHFELRPPRSFVRRTIDGTNIDKIRNLVALLNNIQYFEMSFRRFKRVAYLSSPCLTFIFIARDNGQGINVEICWIEIIRARVSL